MVVAGDVSSLDEDDAYALGLWCADGYHRSSSIGLSNVDPRLIARFGSYLGERVGKDRLRLRIYAPEGLEIDDSVLDLTDARSFCLPVKMKRTAYHVYVNSRPLLRQFRAWRDDRDRLHDRMIGPYLAGRFDGDGCLGSGRVPGSRICYSSELDALRDLELMRRAGLQHVGLSFYRKAAEWSLYVHAQDDPTFRSMIAPYSSKLLVMFRASPSLLGT